MFANRKKRLCGGPVMSIANGRDACSTQRRKGMGETPAPLRPGDPLVVRHCEGEEGRKNMRFCETNRIVFENKIYLKCLIHRR
jgi:hypothetical protein